jgi:uncharacterized protein (TIGR02391 family)
VSIPENVRKYADMAYAAAESKIGEETEIKLADIREQLGAKGLTQSSVMDREVARVHAEKVKALVRGKAESLIEGYELYDRLDEHAAKAVLQEVATLHQSMMTSLSAGARNHAQMQAWRTRSSGQTAAAQAEEFGRQVDRLSTPILNEIACEIERRRMSPKVNPKKNSVHAALAAVRPTGDYSYHPEIQRVSQRLCEEGNFRQAVLDAFIHLIHTVRVKTGLPYDGDDLMNRAFSPDGRVPPVRFNSFQTEGEKNEQRGIWCLFKGIVGLRNFKAHVVNTFDDPHRAHEYLALASLLMRLLDAATIDSSPKPGNSPP